MTGMFYQLDKKCNWMLEQIQSLNVARMHQEKPDNGFYDISTHVPML